MLLSSHKTARKNHDILIANRFFENVEQLKYLDKVVTNQNLIHGAIKERDHQEHQEIVWQMIFRW
jgi:hypothetical protein